LRKKGAGGRKALQGEHKPMLKHHWKQKLQPQKELLLKRALEASGVDASHQHVTAARAYGKHCAVIGR
jgi:hypothetical protein